MSKMPNVFISYSRADSSSYALSLASNLAGKGFSCIIDQWGTEPGTPPSLVGNPAPCPLLAAAFHVVRRGFC